MAENVTNHLIYYVAIAKEEKDNLAILRIWDNLKIASDDEFVWIKDFTEEQIHSIEVKSLPYKTVYYSIEGYLFLQNSLLPNRHIPSLLWTPIQRAIPIDLPSFNHNFFGINEKISIQITPSDYEKPVFALLVDIPILEQYIQQAPKIRFENLLWTIINQKNALILGLPILPLNGNTYSKHQNILVPLGFDFEYPEIALIWEKAINSDEKNWILWNTDNSYSLILKENFQPLSISSFRKSFQNYES
jgi:MoxR-vWA-beta-propeller ternary system domain bpX2